MWMEMATPKVAASVGCTPLHRAASTEIPKICRNAEKICLPNDVYASTSSVFASEVNQDSGSVSILDRKVSAEHHLVFDPENVILRRASTSEALTVDDSGQKHVISSVNVSPVEKHHIGSVNELDERATSTGTTVIGVRSRYGVFLLHDGIVTEFSDQYVPCIPEDKGGALCDGIYFVNAGNVRFLAAIKKMLRDRVREYITNRHSLPTIRYLSQSCVLSLRTKRYRKAFPTEQAAVILGAIENGIPSLHAFARNKEQDAWEWACSVSQCFGSGSPFAKPIVERFNEYLDTDLDDYVNMLERAVIEASKRDKSTGGNIRIMLITSAEDMVDLVDEDVHHLQMRVGDATMKWNIKKKKRIEAKFRRRQKRRKKNRRRSEVRKKQRGR